MITLVLRPLIGLSALLMVGLPVVFESHTLRAEDPPPANPRKTIRRLERRIARLEQQLSQLHGEVDPAATESKLKPSSGNGRRFQMMPVGERVVILDTETGETRMIEPSSSRPIQNVEVGKALVVVTVLGRVMPLTPLPANPATVPPPPKSMPSQPAADAEGPKR